MIGQLGDLWSFFGGVLATSIVWLVVEVRRSYKDARRGPHEP